MYEWNVVVTVREGEFSRAHRILEQFGEVQKTGFFNLLAMWAVDPGRILASLEELALEDTEAIQPLMRVIPVSRSFTFQSPHEFDMKARQTVREWLPLVAQKSFHVRMHRRGFKGKLSSMEEEQNLDRYLLSALTEQGMTGRITFDDPDVIIALETIGSRAGVSAWTREDLRRYPLLHLD